MRAKWRAALVVAAFLSALPPAVRSQSSAEADLQVFLDKSSGRYSSGGTPDAEDELYAIAKAELDLDAVLGAFAEQRGISAGAAGSFLALLADALRYEQACYGGQRCDAADVDAITRRYVETLAAEDRSGDLAVALAHHFMRHLTPTLLATLGEHPAHGSILARLYDYSWKGAFLVPLLAADGAERSALLLSTRAGEGVTDDVQLAVAELLLGQADVDWASPENAALTARYLNLLFENGLHDRALAFFDSWPASRATAFWSSYTALDSELYLRTRASDEGELALNLAAAYLDAGRREESRAALARAASPPRLEVSSPSADVAVAGLLEELLEPRIEREALYDYLVAGLALDDAALAELHEERRRASASGWLWAVRDSAPVLRSLARELLTTTGYPEMAAYLNGEHYRRFEAAYETEVTQDLRTALGAALGRAFVERNAELRELIRAARGSPRPNAASARDAEPADPRPAPFHFVEKPVPAEHRAAPDIEASFQLPEGMELPVDAYFVARLARGEGDVWYLVYASHALDPVGEISAGGYWLARSTDGGRTWAGPWYLGLQQYFPYVVRADSTLPIAAGEMIRLEVLVRELDTGSITFPPVGLTTKAERDGVYLEFALADVVRDADGDGLTDIVERRLGTDPSRQDTDGDRLRDDLDGVPLVPYDAAAAGDGRIATAFLQAVYGVENAGLITGLAPDGGVEEALRSILDPPRRAIDPEDTLFVSGDPALFAGANPRIRIIVGGKRRVDSAGAFYPLAVEQVFKNHDASRVYIIWSAGWQGGEMLLTGGPARYTIHELSRWIT